MTLPASFARDGFLPAAQARGKTKHLLIGTDGWSGTGKTEFGCSAPGPGIVLCVDPDFESMTDNPNPPTSRQDDFAFRTIKVPLATQATQDQFVEYWNTFYGWYKKALDNPDCRTVVLDGDSDTWELQRLAEFGRLEKVPPIKYVHANAVRRAMIARAFHSGKIVIMTNKLKDGYTATLNKNGDEIRIKNGSEERQGFSDHDYLVQVQLRHMKKDGKYGVQIMKCKSDSTVEGMELWGDDCNFQSLVQVIYPNVSLAEWGYK